MCKIFMSVGFIPIHVHFNPNRSIQYGFDPRPDETFSNNGRIDHS